MPAGGVPGVFGTAKVMPLASGKEERVFWGFSQGREVVGVNQGTTVTYTGQCSLVAFVTLSRPALVLRLPTLSNNLAACPALGISRAYFRLEHVGSAKPRL